MKSSLALALTLASTLIAQGPPAGGGPGGVAGDGIWRRNAAFGETQTFDSCQGHQPNNGAYHYHINPLCLRAQLKDNVVLIKNSRVGAIYNEKTSGFTHSPILGWAQDGYPIYGPYGYTNPKDSASPIKRMASSYQLRSITVRTSLPAWSVPNHSGVSQQLSASQYGPPVSALYPLGRYVEDYDYVNGLGDLDQYNGRTTVTPEFPNGTYAYFISLDSNGNPAFPYILAGQFYGTASGSQTQNVTGTLQDYFNNGSYQQTPATTPLLASWATTSSTKFASIVSGVNPAAGPVTTWPGTLPIGMQVNGGVTTPAYAEIQRIRYSGSQVYVNANDMPGYTFGPWFGFASNGGVFINFPSSQNLTYQFPSSPSPATTQTATGLGACGLWVNGVEVFNFLDGASYSNSAAADQGGGIATPGVVTISGASFEGGPVAPSSIVAAFPMFGAVLASSAASASSANWPTTLGGATVTVRDSSGTTRTAQISYASPSQLNFVVPPGTAAGVATATFTVGSTSVTASLNVTPTYPNLFTSNATDLAAAYVQYQNGQVSTVDHAVSAGSVSNAAYLVLVGSGLGNTSQITATIGGLTATVAYAGPQGTYPGVDQYNLLIPPSLAGKGQADVVITAAGLPSNKVNITLQ
jgi:uncharacterized protein (TIGR03437 family)